MYQNRLHISKIEPQPSMEDCAICLQAFHTCDKRNTFTKTTHGRIRGCKHKFHGKCLAQWMLKQMQKQQDDLNQAYAELSFMNVKLDAIWLELKLYVQRLKSVYQSFAKDGRYPTSVLNKIINPDYFDDLEDSDPLDHLGDNSHHSQMESAEPNQSDNETATLSIYSTRRVSPRTEMTLSSAASSSSLLPDPSPSLTPTSTPPLSPISSRRNLDEYEVFTQTSEPSVPSVIPPRPPSRNRSLPGENESNSPYVINPLIRDSLGREFGTFRVPSIQTPETVTEFESTSINKINVLLHHKTVLMLTILVEQILEIFHQRTTIHKLRKVVPLCPLCRSHIDEYKWSHASLEADVDEEEMRHDVISCQYCCIESRGNRLHIYQRVPCSNNRCKSSKCPWKACYDGNRSLIEDQLNGFHQVDQVNQVHQIDGSDRLIQLDEWVTQDSLFQLQDEILWMFYDMSQTSHNSTCEAIYNTTVNQDQTTDDANVPRVNEDAFLVDDTYLSLSNIIQEMYNLKLFMTHNKYKSVKNLLKCVSSTLTYQLGFKVTVTNRENNPYDLDIEYTL